MSLLNSLDIPDIRAFVARMSGILPVSFPLINRETIFMLHIGIKPSFLVFGLLAATSLLVSGCGPSKGTVTGKVTLDSIPLKGGRVDFSNKSGGASATVEISEDGSYSLVGLTAGDYTVTVVTDHLKTTGGGGRMPGSPAGGKGGGGIPKENAPPKTDMPGNPADHGYVASMPGDSAKKYMKIPSKYSDETQSGLTYNFTGGSQVHDIPLTSGGPK